jgi:hypothetical protein
MNVPSSPYLLDKRYNIISFFFAASGDYDLHALAGESNRRSRAYTERAACYKHDLFEKCILQCKKNRRHYSEVHR